MSKRAAGAVPHISSTGAYFVDSSVDKLAFEQRPLLSRKEAAVVLRVSPQTLAAWASNRRVVLPYAKIGHRPNGVNMHSELITRSPAEDDFGDGCQRVVHRGPRPGSVIDDSGN